jgi:hypothetical protein
MIVYYSIIFFCLKVVDCKHNVHNQFWVYIFKFGYLSYDIIYMKKGVVIRLGTVREARPVQCYATDQTSSHVNCLLHSAI